MYMKLKYIDLSEEDKIDVNRLILAYRKHLYPENEIINLQNSLALLKQNSGESIEEFVIRIEIIVEKAYRGDDFGHRAAYSTLMNGMKNQEIKRVILQKSLGTFKESAAEAIKLEQIEKSLTNDKQVEIENQVEIMKIRDSESGLPSTTQQPLGDSQLEWSPYECNYVNYPHPTQERFYEYGPDPTPNYARNYRTFPENVGNQQHGYNRPQYASFGPRVNQGVGDPGIRGYQWAPGPSRGRYNYRNFGNNSGNTYRPNYSGMQGNRGGSNTAFHNPRRQGDYSNLNSQRNKYNLNLNGPHQN